MTTDNGTYRELAYADPPYVGKSWRYDHPEAVIWDDPDTHIAMMFDLDDAFDGWALSCNGTTVKDLWHDAPPGTRLGIWAKSFCAFKRNVRIAYAWEGVLFKPGRDRSADGAPVGRDILIEPITLRKGLCGVKPAAFNLWVLKLLGYVPGDTVHDLFPGSGGMADAIHG